MQYDDEKNKEASLKMTLNFISLRSLMIADEAEIHDIYRFFIPIHC